MSTLPPPPPQTDEISRGTKKILSTGQIFVTGSILAYTIFVFIKSSQGGFSRDFRSLDPEMILYGLCQAAGSCLFVFIASVIGSIVALIQGQPKKIIGWIIVSLIAVFVMYVALWIIPPSQSILY